MLNVSIRVTEPGQGELCIGRKPLQTILLVTPDDLDELEVAIQELRANLNHIHPTWTVTSD
jgi:hypothetical protein